MSSINNVRKLQILYFSKKNKRIKNIKNDEKKWLDIGVYTYYFWNPATCSCKNGKYLVKDSPIAHDEIMEDAGSYQNSLRLLCNKIFIIKR